MTIPTKIRNGLYISDIEYTLENDPFEEFDVVINVSQSESGGSEQAQNFPLWDDVGNDEDDFARAVSAVLKAMESDGDVLVHCVAGQSRSPCVVATALAKKEGVHYNEARDWVWQERPSIHVHPALKSLALEFLGQDPF